MLNAVSWQQYSTAIILCTLAWYAYTGLRFYQPELRALLRIQPKANAVMPPVASPQTAVMGAISPDPDTGVFDAAELRFVDASTDEIGDQTLPKGPADELLEEAQALVVAYADNDDKSTFLSLLQTLLNKYEVVADEISLPALITSLKSFAQTKLPFSIQDTEWPLNF
jgi:hypothetical protein